MMTDTGTPRSVLADLFSRVIAHALPIVYFLVTIAFYLRTYDSAQIKITLTQIGCTAIFLLWVGQLVLERRWPIRGRDWLLAAPLVAMMVSGIISFVHSSFLPMSVDEFLRRMFYIGMGLIVLLEFRSYERHRRLLRWLLAALAIVVVYGVIQYFDTRLFPPGQSGGLDPFVWRFAFGPRVFSTFGNPNFFGNFLVIMTPLLLAIHLKSRGQVFRPYLVTALMVALMWGADKLLLGMFGGVDVSSRGWVQAGVLFFLVALQIVIWWKNPTASAAAMLLFWAGLFLNLYATETKGAWIGFSGALIVSSIFVGLFFTGNHRRLFSRRLLVFIILLFVFTLAIVTHYARRRMNSVNFRTFTWIATWEMIRTQPLLGTGIGTFKVSYPAYRRPEIILIEGKSNTETDHAEDEYLEVWYDEGLIGFGIFLWLLATIIIGGARALYRLTVSSRAPPSEGEELEPRAYYLLGYLGAYCGGLIHWFVDVSIRFVSSGIYSGLLPGAVASFIRNDPLPARQDERSPLDRWVRVGVWSFWLIIFMSLNMSLGPVVLTVASFWLLGECLEWHLVPEDPTPVPAGLASDILEKSFKGISLVQGGALVVLLGLFLWGTGVFRNFFMADVNHNLAIFFSKQGIWTRSAEYEASVGNLPADMQAEYQQVGGALEHYKTVCRLNPFFPMARYFIGNVYNDWGSTIHNQSVEALQKGNRDQAIQLKKRSQELWFKGLETYEWTKQLAPNYVQTHHQVGLIYLKMGDQANYWGDRKQTEKYWNLALKNFGLYRNLDPVFPPNYYRIAYIHYMRHEYEKAAQAYQGALRFNAKYPDRNVETYMNLGRLYFVWLQEALPQSPRTDPRTMEPFKKAEEAYLKGLEQAKTLYVNKENAVFEAMKGVAILYTRVNLREQAIGYWQQLRMMRPNDPDVQNVFRVPGS